MVRGLPVIPERSFPTGFAQLELTALVAPILTENGAVKAGILIVP